MRTASALVSGRRHVGIVLSDVFLRRITPGLFPFLRERWNYQVFDIQRPIGEILRFIKQLQPAGLLIEVSPRKSDRILQLGFPTIVVDTDEVHPRAISMDVDDWKIGEEVATHYLESGFQHFAFFGNASSYSRQRHEGYVRKLKSQGATCFNYLDLETLEKDYLEIHQAPDKRLTQWLKKLPKPVGLFAAHDPLAYLISELCLQIRIRVPEEVAVVGANNDELVCNLAQPPLSSVGIPWSLIGGRLGELMKDFFLHGKNAGKAFRVDPEPITLRKSSDLSAIDDPQLSRALQYMHQHYRESITLAKLCADLRISRRSLELKCLKHLGRSPRAEIVRLKVEKAKSLLAQTDREMGWIAQESGFVDAKRLAVVFRSELGLTPSTYRQKYRPGEPV